MGFCKKKKKTTIGNGYSIAKLLSSNLPHLLVSTTEQIVSINVICHINLASEDITLFFTSEERRSGEFYEIIFSNNIYLIIFFFKQL